MPRHPPVILLAISVGVTAAGDDVIEVADVDEGSLFGGDILVRARSISELLLVVVPHLRSLFVHTLFVGLVFSRRAEGRP
jgi:hypothetical protein